MLEPKLIELEEKSLNKNLSRNLKNFQTHRNIFQNISYIQNIWEKFANLMPSITWYQLKKKNVKISYLYFSKECNVLSVVSTSNFNEDFYLL